MIEKPQPWLQYPPKLQATRLTLALDVHEQHEMDDLRDHWRYCSDSDHCCPCWYVLGFPAALRAVNSLRFLMLMVNAVIHTKKP